MKSRAKFPYCLGDHGIFMPERNVTFAMFTSDQQLATAQLRITSLAQWFGTRS